MRRPTATGGETGEAARPPREPLSHLGGHRKVLRHRASHLVWLMAVNPPGRLPFFFTQIPDKNEIFCLSA